MQASAQQPIAGVTAGEPPIPRFAWVLLASAALLVVGSFLPWAKATAPFVGTITRSGTEGGDGWFTVAGGIGVVLIAAQVFQRRVVSRANAGFAIVLGIGAGILAAYEFSDISNRFSSIHAQTDLVATSYGSGLGCVSFAAAALIIGGLIALANVASRNGPTTGIVGDDATETGSGWM
jgi:hypothetical protein